MNDCVSRLTLDRLAERSLCAADESQVVAHLATCARCHAESELMQSARQRFAHHVLARTLPELRARRWRHPIGVQLLPSLVAVAAMVAIIPRLWRAHEPEMSTKGGAALKVFARRQGEVFAVKDGAALRAGDELRFVVTSGGHPFLLLGSIDGAGKSNIYFPFGGEKSERLIAARTELPGSVILDNAKGPERVFALFSKQPIAADELQRALDQLGQKGAAAIRSIQSLAISADLQLSIRIEKVDL